MTRTRLARAVLACSILIGLEIASSGQTTHFSGAMALPANQTITNQTQQVLNFYARSQSATNALTQIPRRPVSPAAPSWQPRPVKPFTGGSLPTPVSPYLNLFRLDESDSAPNYYAFVRPQLDQQETAHRQQMEIQRLNRQVRAASASLGLAPGAGKNLLPSTGHATRYMNTGGYYHLTR